MPVPKWERKTMESDQSKRERLVRFLDEKAFDPILRKSADEFKGEMRKKFEDVKKSTENEKNRFHNDYKTAKDVKDNYLSDLQSKTAEKKTAELEDLGLPRLPQFKDEFLSLCSEIGV
jgi:hypothetical protein